MNELIMELPGVFRRYPIMVESGCRSRVAPDLIPDYRGRRAVIITDTNVGPLYAGAIREELRAGGVEAHVIEMPAGEPNKTPETVFSLLSCLVDLGMDRGDIVIALGGGVVGDIAGFTASIYLRGLSLVQIPTSVIAQVDSSVGGKTGVNLPEGKNLTGTFYHPRAVYVDPHVLTTLPDAYFIDGFAEVIKHAFIQSATLYDTLAGFTSIGEVRKSDKLKNIIYRNCAIKKKVVEQDEREGGLRRILNYGHTLGHVVENYFGYDTYSHGQGVAIGMAAMARIGEALGITEAGVGDQIQRMLTTFGLPTEFPEMKQEEVLSILRRDKKAYQGEIHAVFLRQIGSACVETIEPDTLIRHLYDR
mgnify:CR=1 FL=1